MSNIVVEHYGSVSFHDGVANIIPQFFTTVDHHMEKCDLLEQIRITHK
jgi:hypothetical protein